MQISHHKMNDILPCLLDFTEPPTLGRISLLCRNLYHFGNRKAWKMCRAQGVKHKGAESWVSKLIRQWRPPCPRCSQRTQWNPLLVKTCCNICNGPEYWQERSRIAKGRGCYLNQCPPECCHRTYQARAEHFKMLTQKHLVGTEDPPPRERK
jgi:hypothetical protein